MRFKLFTILVVTVMAVSTQVYAETVWEYNYITFTKPTWADWTQPQYQDRITANVTLTRGNTQGLFNYEQEDHYQGYDTSPLDTKWAFLGLQGNPNDNASVTASNYQNLFFDSFANALDTFVGEYIVGRPGVLHLVSDDIYLNIQFSEWDCCGEGGGFSYTRTSAVPEPTTMLLLGSGLLGLAGYGRKKFFKK
jgi:hypothetical protein